MDDKNEATRPTATTPVEAGEVMVEALARTMCRKLGATGDAERVEQQRVDHEWRAFISDVMPLMPIISAAITAAEQRGAERERGKVVAWFRGGTGRDTTNLDRSTRVLFLRGLHSYANAIETGAHDG